MSHAPLTVGRMTTLAEVARCMMGWGVGSAIVADGTEVVGIITERDLLRSMGEECSPRNTAVWEYMTDQPVLVTRECSVERAAALFDEGGFRHLPVVDASGSLVGVVSIRDVLRHYRSAHTGASAESAGPTAETS